MVRLIALGGFLGALITAAIFLGSIWSQVGYVPGFTGPAMDWSLAASQPVVERARTNAFMALVIYQLAFIWNCRDEYNPVWKTHIRGSKHLIAAVLFSLSLSVSVVVFPPLHFALGTVALSAMSLVITEKGLAWNRAIPTEHDESTRTIEWTLDVAGTDQTKGGAFAHHHSLRMVVHYRKDAAFGTRCDKCHMYSAMRARATASGAQELLRIDADSPDLAYSA
jgi:hypothetical protein